MEVHGLIVIHVQLHTFNFLRCDEIMTTTRVHDEPLVSFFNWNSDAHDVSSLAITTDHMFNIVLNEDLSCGFVVFVIINLHSDVQLWPHDNEYFINVFVISPFIKNDSHRFTTTDCQPTVVSPLFIFSNIFSRSSNFSMILGLGLRTFESFTKVRLLIHELFIQVRPELDLLRGLGGSDLKDRLLNVTVITMKQCWSCVRR